MSKKIELTRGAVITTPGSSVKTKTGGWRSSRPVMIYDKCIKCGICWANCPDNAIRPIENEKDKNFGKFEVNYDYCKGCLICYTLCPSKAIDKEVEDK